MAPAMPTMIAPGHWFEHISNNRFAPWESALAEAADALRGHVDLVVALFHRPAAEIPALLRACPAVGLVLAGHSHTEAPQLQWSGKVPISPVGEGGRTVRLVGLRSVAGSITMDELLEL